MNSCVFVCLFSHPGFSGVPLIHSPELLVSMELLWSLKKGRLSCSGPDISCPCDSGWPALGQLLTGSRGRAPWPRPEQTELHLRDVLQADVSPSEPASSHVAASPKPGALCRRAHNYLWGTHVSSRWSASSTALACSLCLRIACRCARHREHVLCGSTALSKVGCSLCSWSAVRRASGCWEGLGTGQHRFPVTSEQ